MDISVLVGQVSARWRRRLFLTRFFSLVFRSRLQSSDPVASLVAPCLFCLCASLDFVCARVDPLGAPLGRVSISVEQTNGEDHRIDLSLCGWPATLCFLSWSRILLRNSKMYWVAQPQLLFSILPHSVSLRRTVLPFTLLSFSLHSGVCNSCLITTQDPSHSCKCFVFMYECVDYLDYRESKPVCRVHFQHIQQVYQAIVKIARDTISITEI